MIQISKLLKPARVQLRPESDFGMKTSDSHSRFSVILLISLPHEQRGWRHSLPELGPAKISVTEERIYKG